MAITGVDAEYLSNGEIMIRSLDDPDRIAGTHITLNDDSQISPGSRRLGEAARKQLIIHPNSKPPARDARLGNLENSGSDRPTLADERIVHRNPFGREVFAKLATFQRSTDLLFPPACVFDGVCVDHLIGSAMRFSIRLVVAVEVDAASSDPTGYR